MWLNSSMSTLVSVRLLKRRKVLALEVFHQGDFKGLAVVELLDDDRHFVKLGLLRRPPAAFAGDNLENIGFVGMPAHQDGLKNAFFGDGARQIVEMVLVHAMAGLEFTRPKQVDFDGLVGPHAVEPRVILVFLAAEQRRQASSEVGALRVGRHHATTRRSRRKTSPARWR